MTQEDNIVKVLKEIEKELCRIRITAESINDYVTVEKGMLLHERNCRCNDNSTNNTYKNPISFQELLEAYRQYLREL